MRPSRRTRKVDPANRRFPNSLFRRCSDGASLPDHCMNDSELCIAYPVSPELFPESVMITNGSPINIVPCSPVHSIEPVLCNKYGRYHRTEI